VGERQRRSEPRRSLRPPDPLTSPNAGSRKHRIARKRGTACTTLDAAPPTTPRGERRKPPDILDRGVAGAALRPGPFRALLVPAPGAFGRVPRRRRAPRAGVPALARHPDAPELTPRGLEVLRLLAKHLPLKDVAARLQIRKLTVRTHVERMQVALLHDQATS
jgi:DNA-binding CsgD family transcriptional regulator